MLRGNYHFSHGVLETREVDPGQEYFFDLGRFTRNDVSGHGRGRARPAPDGDRWERGCERRGLQRLRPVLPLRGEHRPGRPRRRAGGGHAGDVVLRATIASPRPTERPIVEVHRARHPRRRRRPDRAAPHRGRIEVGYRHWSNPEAGAADRATRGSSRAWRSSASSRPTTFARPRAAGGTTDLSAYEDNAFYVSTFVGGARHAPPFPSASPRAGRSATSGTTTRSRRRRSASRGRTRSSAGRRASAGTSACAATCARTTAAIAGDSNIPGSTSPRDGFIVQFGIGFAPVGSPAMSAAPPPLAARCPAEGRRRRRPTAPPAPPTTTVAPAPDALAFALSRHARPSTAWARATCSRSAVLGNEDLSRTPTVQTNGVDRPAAARARWRWPASRWPRSSGS